jgi:hypothetical protein
MEILFLELSFQVKQTEIYIIKLQHLLRLLIMMFILKKEKIIIKTNKNYKLKNFFHFITY